MASLVYHSFHDGLMKAGFNLNDTDEIRAVLVTSTYAPNAGTHTQYSHITNQVTGTGYDTGGKALTTPTVVTAAGTTTFDADNVSWASSTITARALVLYKFVNDGGSPAATSPLIGYFDFGVDESSEDGTFAYNWNTSGIITLAASA